MSRRTRRSPALDLRVRGRRRRAYQRAIAAGASSLARPSSLFPQRLVPGDVHRHGRDLSEHPRAPPHPPPLRPVRHVRVVVWRSSLRRRGSLLALAAPRTGHLHRRRRRRRTDAVPGGTCRRRRVCTLRRPSGTRAPGAVARVSRSRARGSPPRAGGPRRHGRLAPRRSGAARGAALLVVPPVAPRLAGRRGRPVTPDLSRAAA